MPQARRERKYSEAAGASAALDYSSAKFFRIARPSAWLFSGWN
jgi:hypothetical protein